MTLTYRRGATEIRGISNQNVISGPVQIMKFAKRSRSWASSVMSVDGNAPKEVKVDFVERAALLDLNKSLLAFARA
jgi:hypothetical protein